MTVFPSFNSEPEIVSLWGDLHPPQSDPAPKQEPTTERRHIKVSLEELAVTSNFTQRKMCDKCQKMKLLIDFSKGSRNNFGRKSYCKKCCAEHQRRVQSASRKREHWLKKTYDITLEEYDAMFEAQNGLCKSCGNPETKMHPRSKTVLWLAVDHDHVTGKVRSLLCDGCNLAYGALQEDIQRIEALRSYYYWVHGEDAS